MEIELFYIDIKCSYLNIKGSNYCRGKALIKKLIETKENINVHSKIKYIIAESMLYPFAIRSP